MWAAFSCTTCHQCCKNQSKSDAWGRCCAGFGAMSVVWGAAASQNSCLMLQQSRHALKWQFFQTTHLPFMFAPSSRRRFSTLETMAGFSEMQFWPLPVHPHSPQLMARSTSSFPVPLCLYSHPPGNQTSPHLPIGCQNLSMPHAGTFLLLSFFREISFFL